LVKLFIPVTRTYNNFVSLQPGQYMREREGAG